MPGSRKCECGIDGTCIDRTKWCNCDAALDTWAADEGEILEKEFLPVRQLRFGDTGTPLDDKEGNLLNFRLIVAFSLIYRRIILYCRFL